MKAYKRSWDVENNKFCLVEFDITHEYDFSHDPEVNLVGEENSHNCHFDIMQKSVDYDNTRIVSSFDINDIDEWGDDDVLVCKCPDCGKYYEIRGSEARWFLDRSLKLPKRCYICRRNRKRK